MSLGDLINIIKDCDIYTAGVIVIIALIFWLFKMYQKNANKSRDNKDALIDTAIQIYIEALENINGDNVDYSSFCKLLRFTKTNDDYYSLNDYIENKDKEALKEYIKCEILYFKDKQVDTIYEPEFSMDYLPKRFKQLRINENIIKPAILTLFTIYILSILILCALGLKKNPLSILTIMNISISYIFIMMFLTSFLDNDKVLLSSYSIKVMLFLELISAMLIGVNNKSGNFSMFICNICFIILLFISKAYYNIKDITNVVNSKRKFITFRIIDSFIKLQNEELIDDIGNVITFAYTYRAKICAVFQFEKSENSELKLIKDIRKPYYNKTILDSKNNIKKEIENLSKCKISSFI